MSRNLLSRWRSWWPYAVAALLLWAVTAGYYKGSFGEGERWLLALAITGLFGFHLCAGGRLFRTGRSFPWRSFVIAVVCFVLVRWVLAYLLLQHHLPETTVFHDPQRALWFIFPSTAILVVLGFGLAQYRTARMAETNAVPPRQTPPRLNFRSEGRNVSLPPGEVNYVQARGEYVVYHCAERRYPRFQRLKEAEAELAPYGFVRTHRSYLVNRRSIREVGTREVALMDGTTVPVSRTYRMSVRELLERGAGEEP